MNLQIVLPEWSMKMPWVGALRKTLVDDDLTFVHAPTEGPDAHVYMWCKDIKPFDGIPIVVYVRRFEFYDGSMAQVDWDRVGHVVFVNTFMRDQFLRWKPGLAERASVIYNCFDPDRWTYGIRSHGPKIAMVGQVNYRKNIPMALQILQSLPPNASLHIVGAVLQRELLAYTEALRPSCGNVYYYRYVDEIDAWLQDKNYLLHCSVSEGNPNCVIEAMAKGIKPVVHEFPGAHDQFPESILFRTIPEAVSMMQPVSGYHSDAYREWADERFSMRNLLVLREVIEQTLGVAA